MRPAPGTRLFFIGTEGVLFDAPRQQLHAFNTTACVIWCHLEAGLTPAAIAHALAAENGSGEASAQSHVAVALADWGAKGLLDGVTPAPIAPSPIAERAPDLPPAPDHGFAVVRNYRMLGVAARIRCVCDAHARLVQPLLEHLADDSAKRPDLTLDIAPVAGGIGFWCDGVPAARCDAEDEIAPLAKALVWSAVLRRQDYALHIHAGVVGGRTGCVLLPAAPGSGKSTLVAALVHAGFDLFSDEVALLAPGSFAVSPFPTAICVKDTGIEAIARLYPHVRGLPVHRRGDGKRVAYLPPPACSVPSEGHRRAVRGIVFPRYAEGANMTQRRLGPAEALARLLQHCQSVGRPLDHGAIGALLRWIETLPCSEIEYGSLSPACGFIGAMLRADPSVSG